VARIYQINIFAQLKQQLVLMGTLDQWSGSLLNM
jgi:hypothetical protein